TARLPPPDLRIRDWSHLSYPGLVPEGCLKARSLSPLNLSPPDPAHQSPQRPSRGAGPDRDDWRRTDFFMRKLMIMPPNGSAEDFLGSREEPGEIQPVGTGAAGRFEVGALPVARHVIQSGIEPPRFGAVAVMVVISEEPGQVAQLGGRPGGAAAPAVAR